MHTYIHMIVIITMLIVFSRAPFHVSTNIKHSIKMLERQKPEAAVLSSLSCLLCLFFTINNQPIPEEETRTYLGVKLDKRKKKKKKNLMWNPTHNGDGEEGYQTALAYEKN